MGDLLLKNVLFAGLATCDIVYYSFIACLGAFVTLICYGIYLYARPKFPARVNCWFCNKNTLVNWKIRNGWDCPFCDQYNGFTPEGDYNTDIQKRFVRDWSHNSCNAKTEPNNGLCRLCNINQQLKIQQLARFTPMVEDNYDKEIEHFRQQLEKSYRLCDVCEKTLAQTLEEQKYRLLTDRLNSHVPSVRTRRPLPIRSWDRIRAIQSIVRWSSLAAITLNGVILTVENVYPLFLNDLPDLFISGSSRSHWLTASSLVLFLCSIYRNGRSQWDGIILCLMLGTQLICSTGYSFPLMVSSIVTICLLIYSTNERMCFKTVKNSNFNLTNANFPTPLTANISTRKTEQNLNFDKIKTNDPISQVENTSTLRNGKTRDKIQTRSQSLKWVATELPSDNLNPSSLQSDSCQTPKTFKPMKDIKAKSPDVKCESPRPRFSSPPPEVYDRLNGLHLSMPGDQSEKTKRPRNFLTEPLSWAKNGSKGSSLIKPAKFIPFSNSAEEQDRSSTPSSSSSSTHEPFSKALSPVCSQFPPTQYGKISPQSFYDFHQPYIHATSPYPTQFPMSHTTVFTYSPFTPYPYGFPPKSFTPPYEYSSLSSPRFSEVNSTAGTENLWESYQSSARWSTLKRVLFTSSIIVNVCSVAFLLISHLNPWFYASNDS